MRHLVTAGAALLAAAACASPRRPQTPAEVAAGLPACEAWRRLSADSAFLAKMERLAADTTRFADLELRIAQLMADTALYAALSAGLDRLGADTSWQTQRTRLAADTAIQARVARLSRRLDSMVACAARGGSGKRR